MPPEQNAVHQHPSPRPPSPSAREKPLRAEGSRAFWLTWAICMATWLILSGKFDLFHVSLGLISCLIVARISSTLMLPPGATRGLLIRSARFVGYLPWLLVEIFKANLHILKLTFHPRMMALIDPNIVTFNSRLRGEMPLFVLANSITLTPGTITVFVNTFGAYTVHAIDRQSGAAVPGEMEERIAAVFEER